MVMDSILHKFSSELLLYSGLESGCLTMLIRGTGRSGKALKSREIPDRSQEEQSFKEIITGNKSSEGTSVWLNAVRALLVFE